MVTYTQQGKQLAGTKYRKLKVSATCDDSGTGINYFTQYTDESKIPLGATTCVGAVLPQGCKPLASGLVKCGKGGGN